MAAVTLFGKEETFTIYNYYAKNKYVNKYGSYEKIFKNVNKNTIITGDFNLKHECWNPEGDTRHDAEAEDLLSFLNDNGLSFKNDGQITHLGFKEQRDSAIDLSIVSSHLHLKSEFLVIDNCFGSDHLPIKTVINAKIKIEEKMLPERWLVDKATSTQWIEFGRLCTEKLDFDVKNGSINENFNQYLEILNEILEQTIPKSKAKKIKGHKKQNLVVTRV